MTETSNEEAAASPVRTPAELRIAVFRDWKEAERATFSIAAEYGRWLIASLLLIHGGALFGMFSFLDTVADKPELLAGYRYPVWSFVGGLITALLSGFFTWVNWAMHSDNYAAQANYSMLFHDEAWLREGRHSKGITVTYWGSLISGWLSALAILVGAALLLHGDKILAWQSVQ